MMVAQYTLLEDGGDSRMFHSVVVSRLTPRNREDSSLHSWGVVRGGSPQNRLSHHCFSYRIVILQLPSRKILS